MRIAPWICVVVLSFHGWAGDAPRTSAINFAELESLNEPVQIVDARPEAGDSIGPKVLHVRAAQVLNSDGKSAAKFDGAKLAELFGGLDPAAKTVVIGSEKSTESCADVAVVAYALERAGFSKILIASKGVESIPAEAANKLNTIAAGSAKIKLAPQATNPSGAIIDTKEVKDDAIDEEDCQMADVRGADRYLGAEKAEFVKKDGHIPGTRSIPLTVFIEKSGAAFRLRNPDELKKILKQFGYSTENSPVPYGDDAREAAIGYIIFRLAGYEKARCYEAGMADWTADPLFQVVTFKWE